MLGCTDLETSKEFLDFSNRGSSYLNNEDSLASKEAFDYVPKFLSLWNCADTSLVYTHLYTFRVQFGICMQIVRCGVSHRRNHADKSAM